LYFEADLLGITSVHTIGDMFNIQCQISHWLYPLKESLLNKLDKVKMANEETQVLDFTARQFYEENDNIAYVSPFKVTLQQ